MKTLLMFAGQGSQYVGMGKDVYNNYTYANKALNQVNNTISGDFLSLIFNGDENELKKSFNTQPALMAISVATFLALKEEYGIKLDKLNICGVAGHSLGEYSALCVAGCLSIIDTAKILYKRGKAMFNCVSNDTGMMAIIGCDKNIIQKHINNINPKCLVIANSNSIEQIVVSGYKEDIEKFKESISNEAKKLIPLPVSGAFHSPLMKPAEEKMADYIEELNIKPPKYPVLQNYSSKFETEPSVIKDNLKHQITAPIYWKENMQKAIQDGFDTFIEIGAKNVLCGLMKRIITKEQEDKIKIISIEKTEDITNLSTILNQ